MTKKLIEELKVIKGANESFLLTLQNQANPAVVKQLMTQNHLVDQIRGELENMSKAKQSKPEQAETLGYFLSEDNRISVLDKLQKICEKIIKDDQELKDKIAVVMEQGRQEFEEAVEYVNSFKIGIEKS